ncbi:Resolvase domain protein, partial [mine drainage metagenome]
SQIEAMEMYGRGAGLAADEWVQEIGGGMHFKRQRFLNLLDRIQRGRIGKRLVAHQARRVRFGYDRIERRAAENGCEIVVVNPNSRSPQQERVED